MHGFGLRGGHVSAILALDRLTAAEALALNQRENLVLA
jgi:hypothetical protein